jgi:hypothetical protein
MSYGIKNNYGYGIAVSPGDLNRRADVLQAQLPGAFTGLGAGVFGLGELLVDTPLAGQVSAGSALVLNSEGVLVYVHVPEPLFIPVRSDELYLHLALRVPDPADSYGDTAGTDSLRGAPPNLLLSENEEETDALLLASWNGTAWVDERVFSLPADTAQLHLDLAALTARLAALEAGTGGGEDGGEGGIGPIFGTTIPISSVDPTKIKDYIDAVEARIRAEVVPGQRATRQPLDLVVHEMQILRGELGIAQETIRRLSEMLLFPEQRDALGQSGLTVRPRVVERSQSLTIGPNFGSGENSTPDFDGDGPVKNSDGSFGVAL